MALKVANNAWGYLNAGIAAGDTTIVLQTGHGARFPTLAAGDWFYATLFNAAVVLEIVKVTARAGDILTVVRGQDGTTAHAYLAGDSLECRPCAAIVADQMVDAQTNAAPTKALPVDADIFNFLDSAAAFKLVKTTLANLKTALGAAFVTKDSTTGAAALPAGTTAQRPANAAGLTRFNSDTNQFEGNNGTTWGQLGGGATGAGGDTVFNENSLVMNNDYTLTTGKNACMVGPLTIATGKKLTIPTGQRLVIL